MKRINIQEDFVGEPDANQEGLEARMAGNDEVDITVTGGSIVVAIPSGAEASAIFDPGRYVRGELTLENGLTLTFEIQPEAEGAYAQVGREKETA